MRRDHAQKPSLLRTLSEEETMTITSEDRIRRPLSGLASTLLAAAMILGICFSVRAAETQRTFSSPEEAVKAFADAVEAGDVNAMISVLGPEGKDVAISGDEIEDKAGRLRFVASYRTMNRLEVSRGGERAVLSIGDDDWPFPIPVVKKGNAWLFDTRAGREELINRRIGRNELKAMDLCGTYLNAQREYARSDWDNDGVLQYAQKFMSDKGKWNGLYWEAGEDEIKSPLGPFYAKAAEEGYNIGKKKGNNVKPFHGYRFRILKAQGKSAPGGAYRYVINGRMVAGFAMVAFPAEYGSSGIMTFMVSQNGTIYQKDLGRNTPTIALRMKSFNPDRTWTTVERATPDEPNSTCSYR